MARTEAAVQVEGRVWSLGVKLSLSFKNGSRSNLRHGGFFAGHQSKEDLKKELNIFFWKQEQTEDGESLGHYLVPKPPSANSQTNTSEAFENAGRKRKRYRGASDDHDQGEHAHAVSSLPAPYATRSAERKSQLAAAEKRKLAATEKRRLLAAQKNRRLADDHKLLALGIRRTRSGHN